MMTARRSLFALSLFFCASCATAPPPAPEASATAATPDASAAADTTAASAAADTTAASGAADTTAASAVADTTAAPAASDAPVTSSPPPAAFDVKPTAGTRATCPVSDRPFVVDADTATVEHEGRFYVFCCPGCAGEFRAHPSQYAKR